MGQKTHILATKKFPGLPEEMLGAFNPLDMLDPDDEECLDLASSMAGGLVVRSKGDDAHFDDTARSLIKALCLYVRLNAPDGFQNLPYVHTLLMRGAREQMEIDKGSPIDSDDPDPFQAEYGARFLVRGGEYELKEGNVRKRTVVIEFDSYETALACYNSPGYQAALALRKPVSTGDMVVIKGYDG